MASWSTETLKWQTKRSNIRNKQSKFDCPFNLFSSMLTWLEGIKTRSVTFLKCDKVICNLDLKERQRFKYKNYVEAALCAMIIQNLSQCKVDPKSITVITPFLDQQLLLNEHLKPYGIKPVLTIDKCQGIDCDIVILSCVK